MTRFIATLISILAFAGTASAQAAFPCDWQARADNIVEPWEENTRTFANGAVRVALLDAIEPAAAAYYLFILHPPLDEVGGRRCTLVGFTENLGYSGFYFDDLEAGYDPARGLTFSVPVAIYLPEESFTNSALLHINVNQATGDVTVNQELGNE